MEEIFNSLFAIERYMPHGHCYLWQPGLLWLHVLSDALIALAYFSIPGFLFYFVQKRKDLDFHWIFIFFAIFILACGTTHVLEIVNVWVPYYWIAGIVKAVTAITSIATVIFLIKLMPLILALPSPSELERINQQLRKEISDRIHSELVLEQKNKELANLNEELNAFSYSVSHDLRAPLRSMDGFSMALLEDYADKLAPEGKDALNRIRKASQRMGHLINDILRLSKVSSTNITIEQVDLSQIAHEIKTALQDEQPNRNVDWIIDENMQVDADKPLIRIVYQNLIENALKFTSKTDHARIHIGVEQSADGPIYFVADNGAGFDLDNARSLFTPFHRFHSDKEFSGTGIGLALVQRIIRRHNALIWAKSAPGQGATFFFRRGDTQYA